VLTVRPELLTVGAAAGGANTVSGTVISCLFLGTRNHCVVQAGEYRLEVLQNADSAMPAEGAAVTLALKAEHLWLFAREN